MSVTFFSKSGGKWEIFFDPFTINGINLSCKSVTGTEGAVIR